jgi:anti-sigma-K factor RskA
MTADLHTLTGAYAAHALSGQEQLAFEHHLDACPACAQEVRELRATLARLGAAAAAEPPAALWDRVRAEVRVTRQLPPVVGRVERRPRRSGAGAGRRRLPPLLAAAAALLVVATSLAVLNLGLGRPSAPSGPTGDPVAAVLAAPDARTVAARPGGAGKAAVVVSPARGQAVFVARDLPAAPASRTYQLWVVEGAGPRPAGLVDPGAGGRVTRLLDGRVTGTETIAVTVEPRGGSRTPTSKPVAVVDLQRV